MDDHPWMITMITSVAIRIAEGGSKGGGPGGAGAPPGNQEVRTFGFLDFRIFRLSDFRTFTGPCWTLLDPTGPYWTLLDPIGPYWTLLDPTEPYWTFFSCPHGGRGKYFGRFFSCSHGGRGKYFPN